MTKVITISLPEGLAWKINGLVRKTGISRSGLMQRAVCLLISELEAYELPQGLKRTVEDIEQEFRKQKRG